jgi:hypothetical protein
MSKNRSSKYFTNPLGEINYCNGCGDPIIETKGRYFVDIQHDIYFEDKFRLLGNYGGKTFCEKCFKEIFGPLNFKDAESIYEKED